MINIITSICLLYIFAFIFVGLDNLYDIIENWIKYKLNGNKTPVYKSSCDVFDDLKTPKITKIYYSIYRFFLHIVESPSDTYYEIKYFIQRGMKGWSIRDSWSIDWYLILILIPMLKRLKENKQGHPIQVYDKSCDLDETGNSTEKETKKAIKKWDYILDTIIKTFETAQKIQQDYWFYQESLDYDMKLANKYRKINSSIKKKRPKLYDKNDLHVMTKKECINYELGWKYFQKYFFSLWD